MSLTTEINKAAKIVFLTGAGVSTPSGIPDYRSKGGIYDNGQEQPEYLLSKTCLEQEPEKFYQFVTTQMYYPQAQPNIIHQKMSLITQKKSAIIITQNVDGLHVKAGAKQVIEFHGSLYRVYCQRCGQRVDYRQYLQNMYHINCGGILRPDIVLYEEPIAAKTLEKAVAAIIAADLLIVCGTSLRVYPFAGLLAYRQPQAGLIAINREKLDLPVGAEQLTMDATMAFEQLQI
ncbi:NAD-dependent protein deacylase [Liquorilactobacillus ghanensis]|jgi:NAD-dependent deacetylase|uniref:NAD-dependent protein deacylase n=1 Tax=Liquorilactobacillus ghanensis TaxID=399370 RepID=UPI0039E94C4E